MSITRIALLIRAAQPGLYLLGALALFLSLRSFVISRGELRMSEFELERELARRKQANSITRTLGLIELLLAIFAIGNVVAPSLQAEPLNPGNPALIDLVQPTFAPFYTSTPGGNGEEDTGTPGQGGADVISNLLASASAQSNQDSGDQNQILMTPTLAPTVVGTINPDAPKALGCDQPGATLQVPANGQTIFDALTVRGTAFVPSFSHYKFELSGPSTGGSFTPFGDKTSAVPQLGVLGQLNLNAFQPGSYQFRLTVFDTTDTLKASCTVNIELSARPATATPLPPTPTPGGA